ncbi:MAG: hypothetical protein ACTSR3_14230 [Candidatus Helarchaeota archaeon]
MAWKEIKRIEQIIRKERGDEAVIIRLVKENEKIISIIFGIEDKNVINSIELSIDEWNELLSFFKSIESEITPLKTSEVEQVSAGLPTEIETQSDAKKVVIEAPTPIPDISSPPSITEEEEPAAVTILHKTMSTTPKTVVGTPIPEREKGVTPEAVVIEHIEPPTKIKSEEPEPLKQPSLPDITPEVVEPSTDVKIEESIAKIPARPQAIVVEHIEPRTEPKPQDIEPETPITHDIPMIPEVEPEIIDHEAIELPLETEENYPPMPPEVKEIFEELDTQAIELNKTLIDAGVVPSENELTKEIKITNAMQEVAELMPPGAAKDFVEQMILKRKEFQNLGTKSSNASDTEIELVLVDENQKETKDTKEKEKELKYW